jgi:peptidoglycan/xylan/chitin deacetylase (PgdA/CDA1 family)
MSGRSRTLRSMFGGVRRRILCSAHQRLAPIGSHGPIVSFTFDDFPRTAFLTGGSILQRFGLRGTYYTALGMMNTVNECGEQFHSEDIDSLLENGHELASHTYSHVSCRKLSCAAFSREVELGRKAIEEISGSDSGNFAYPFGHITLAAKRTLGPRLVSSRSVIPGLNGPEIDLNLLRANSLYGGLEACSRAEALVAENARMKSWLIFYTHDVRPNPSPYGCLPTLLEAVVAFSVRSGSRIMTVREALSELGIQSGNPEVHAPWGASA